MKRHDIPFNIKLLNPHNSQHLLGLFPVTSISKFDGNSGDFHPQGLYSNIIFGKQGDSKRFEQHSLINLKTSIMHPFYLRQLKRYKSLFRDILLGISYAKWDDRQKTFLPAGIIDGRTGYSFFLEHFNDIVFEKGGNLSREQRVRFLEENRNKAMMSKYIVLPAGLRDIELKDDGLPTEDDINPLYSRLISQASTLSEITAGTNDPVLDIPRKAMTLTSEAIFDHIFNLLEGKRGFLQAKWASRRVFGTTRNTISSLEMGSTDLNDPRAPEQDVTVVGMAQFLAGTLPLMRHALKTRVLVDFLENIRGEVKLVDKETLKYVNHRIPEKISDKWGTDDGLDNLMQGFLEPHNRHEPIVIDGHYLKLIYRDEKGFRLLDKLGDKPPGNGTVKPVTWGELFYIAAAPLVAKVRAFNTRYPITGLGSIYPSRTYLKTTAQSKILFPYNDFGELDKTETNYIEFPATAEKNAYHETMQVHTSTLSALGADFDKTLSGCDILEDTQLSK